MPNEPAAMDDWRASALRKLTDESNCKPTPLIKLVDEGTLAHIWLKDESATPSGSIKHRLARRLFWRAVVDGRIGSDTSLYDASSGSMALSEAWFARMLDLRLEIVVPATISREKKCLLERAGIRLHIAADLEGARRKASWLAERHCGFFIDQFVNAADAYGHDVPCAVFSEIHDQLERSPDWIIAGCGTGGTISSLARAVVLTDSPTRICLADPDGSLFHWLARRNEGAYRPGQWLIDGVGSCEPRPGFRPSLPSHSIAVSDEAAVGASWALSEHLGRPFGSSAGMNLWAAALLCSFHEEPCVAGPIVTLNPDDGARYTTTSLSTEWCETNGLEIAEFNRATVEFLRTGRLPDDFRDYDRISRHAIAG
ncbi:pyridoxal-phosphate dependent enzyme [Qipengyuania sp. 6B39]|uniref:PLP-dependent cysteine synthase family protein n=1 Tax=Qipengyuania proteolytica TaxID=2867239 RepID=UPI001C8A1314|nr:pyridoxal-phosphate dependent enzyme [Qipengyuania proteolytica]MBX7494294.1 pyridoxal-phosphate dependent enzyme [Qipengyuania proteolytica]